MKAATAEGDRAMHTKIYDDLVARVKDLNAMRAVLTAHLAGRSGGGVCVAVDWAGQAAGIPARLTRL